MAKNLAGLAALGALGILMSKRQNGSNVPVEDRSRPASMSAGEDVPADDNGAFYEAGSGPSGADLARNPGPIDDESQWGGTGGATYKEPVKRPATSSQSSRYPSQGTRPSTGNVGPTMQTPRQSVRDVDMIPGQSVQAPQGGERVDNPSMVRRMMEAAGPGRLAGVGKIATEIATANRVQRAYNAAKAAERENVTNPLAWMAGPKGVLGKAVKDKNALSEADTTGGAIGYKKGGSLKAKAKSKSVKMSSGGSARSSASKRGDGIASKGRTRGKMY